MTLGKLAELRGLEPRHVLAGIIVATLSAGLAACGGSSFKRPAIGGVRRPVQIATGQVLGMAVAPDGVWVANHREGSISLIDPRTNRVVRTVGGLGSQPGNPAVGAGALWVPVFQGDRLVRVDLRTGRARSAVRGTFWGAAFGFGSVWLLEWSGQHGAWVDWHGHTVARFDPRTDAVQHIPIAGEDGAIAVGDGGVWVANMTARTLDRIDPRTNRVSGRIKLGVEPNYVAVGESSVWVTAQGGLLLRIDPRAGRVAARIHTGTDAQYLDVGQGAVWIGNVNNITDSTLSEVDPQTNRVVSTMRVPDGPQGVVVGFGSVWVGSFGEAGVIRVPAPS